MARNLKVMPLEKTTTVALALALTTLAGCDVEPFRGFPSDKPPIHLVLDMDFQPKVRAQSESEFEGWHDHRGARRPVHDEFGNTLVVARGSLPDAKLLPRDANKVHVKNPLPLNHKFMVRGREMSVIDRGKERFDIYCAICHGYSGQGGNTKAGHGLVGRRWPAVIPSFHFNPKGDDAVVNRVPNMPDGEYFDVITAGKGTMPGYGARISVEDRWAIVHYVRALQSLSR